VYRREEGIWKRMAEAMVDALQKRENRNENGERNLQ
jgi:hypothetical protein